MQKRLGRNTVVLLGAGHTNAHILRMWKMKPPGNAELICVSNFPIATYSGMMPGVLAGQYNVPEMEIDLVRFCASSGARLILDEVTGIDHLNQRIQFLNRPSLPFDVLSIGVGSFPTFQGVEVQNDSAIVSIKPMQRFLQALKSRFIAASDRSAFRVAIVGGGLGSIEVACCLDQRVKTDPEVLGLKPGAKVNITLVTAAQELGGGLSAASGEHVRAVLEARSIQAQTGQRVRKIDRTTLSLADGTELEADVIVWATSAKAPPLLGRLQLETDDKGFLKTRSTLQTLSNDRIFAVGDSGTMVDQPLPKAGVYAVRQGPVLWDNIRRVLWGRKAIPYRPQEKFLKLVNTADGKAIADYGTRSFYGRWCWKLKDRIDRKFMKMYQDYSMMEMTAPPADKDEAMRCLGCGGKVGSQLLSQVLSELEIPQHDDVVIGLEHPDDAAVLRVKEDQVTVTCDFFASPLGDPYLSGRVGVLNSASDLFVMGARPTGALAIVELPFGHPRAQLQVMRELMAGSVEELSRMGATIVGGHSIEGPRLTIGFTMLGLQAGEPKTKGMLKVGDQLILSKPVGTGVLLAALMQGELPAQAYQELIDVMTQSNQVALDLIERFEVSAMTDVTGFGLAGHLAEMLRASHLSAALDLDAVPKLSGFDGLVAKGIESTLAPENRLVAETIQLRMGKYSEQQSAVLFDPQTSGGLLMGVSPNQSDQVLAFLVDQGFDRAAVIGEVVEGPDKLELALRS